MADLGLGVSESFILFSAFTVYYLVERILRRLVSKNLHSVTFGLALRSSRKDSVYFGILLGALISFFSFPFCATAVWEYRPLAALVPRRFDEKSLSFSGQVCVTSRAVLWISELNRLDLYPQYVVHHLGSIAALLSAIHLDVIELLYIPFVALVTEIPGDLVWLLAAHQAMDPCFNNNKQWKKIKRTVQVANFWIYMLRIPSIPALVYSAILFTQQRPGVWSARGSRALLVWTSLLMFLYSIWVFKYLKGQMKALYGDGGDVVGKEGEKEQTVPPTPHQSSEQSPGVAEIPNANGQEVKIEETETDISLESDPIPDAVAKTFLTWSFQHPIHVRFPNGIILTLYGPLMGMALASLAFVCFLLASPPASSFKDTSMSLLIIVWSAVTGARVLSLIYEDTIAAFLLNPVEVFFRPGFWLYGGLVGAGVGILLSRALGLVDDVERLAAGLCIGLPLYEAISRLGCHTYGCCFGKPIGLKYESSSPVERFLIKLFSPVVYSSRSAAAVRLDPSLRNVPLFPVQRISSALFFLQFFGIVASFLHPLMEINIVRTGAISLICHAIGRIWVETFRDDFRGKLNDITFGGMTMKISATGRMAVVQMIVGLGMIWQRPLTSLIRGEPIAEPPTLLAVNELGLGEILADPWVGACLFVVLGFGTAIYGLHRDEIGRGVAK